MLVIKLNYFRSWTFGLLLLFLLQTYITAENIDLFDTKFESYTLDSNSNDNLTIRNCTFTDILEINNGSFNSVSIENCVINSIDIVESEIVNLRIINSVIKTDVKLGLDTTTVPVALEKYPDMGVPNSDSLYDYPVKIRNLTLQDVQVNGSLFLSLDLSPSDWSESKSSTANTLHINRVSIDGSFAISSYPGNYYGGANSNLSISLRSVQVDNLLLHNLATSYLELFDVSINNTLLASEVTVSPRQGYHQSPCLFSDIQGVKYFYMQSCSFDVDTIFRGIEVLYKTSIESVNFSRSFSIQGLNSGSFAFQNIRLNSSCNFTDIDIGNDFTIKNVSGYVVGSELILPNSQTMQLNQISIGNHLILLDLGNPKILPFSFNSTKCKYLWLSDSFISRSTFGSFLDIQFSEIDFISAYRSSVSFSSAYGKELEVDFVENERSSLFAFARLIDRKYSDNSFFNYASDYQKRNGKSSNAARVQLIRILHHPHKNPGDYLRALGGIISNIIIGNGYTPFRTLIIIVLILALGTIIFRRAYIDNMLIPESEKYSRFYPALFVFDAFIPLVDLGFKDKWVISDSPVKKARFLITLKFILTIMGWIVSTLLVAALTGLIG
jgi:hypothetical protein